MDRRDFLKKSALAGAGFMASQSLLGKVVKDGIPMSKNHADLGSNATNGVHHQAFEERKLGKRKVTSIGLGTVDICPVGYYGCSTTKEVGEVSLRKEPGVLTMYAMSDKENPCMITIMETYSSMEAYRKHIASAHFQKYKQGTLKMVKSLQLSDQIPLNTANEIKNFIITKMVNYGNTVIKP